MNKDVQRYKLRRSQRLKDRGIRLDDDDGRWVTTRDGNKIHLNEEGAVDKGNPYVLASMGKPEKAEMPVKSVQLKESKPWGNSKTAEIAASLSGRKDKNCVFGGFYKVEETRTAKMTHATFFNPYTGEHFTEKVRDMDDDRVNDDPFAQELGDVPLNEKAKWVWNRSNGKVQAGDTIRVMQGRTLEHGTEAKVKSVRELKDRYGRYMATYAYLDNGEKINVSNVGIVEDGNVIGFEAKEKVTKKSKKKIPMVTQDGITASIGKAKTQNAIKEALGKAGYDFEDLSGDSGYPNFRIGKEDGGYFRVYVNGKGRSAEVKVQEWTPAPEDVLKSKSEIEDAKYFVNNLLSTYERGFKKGKPMVFEDMNDAEKWGYVVAQTAAFHIKNGMPSQKAWSRAIDNANSWQEKDFNGYDKAEDEDTFKKKIIGSIIDELKRR